MGRWFSRDPIEEEGGVNLYAMARHDPVNIMTPKERLARLTAVKEACFAFGIVGLVLLGTSCVRGHDLQSSYCIDDVESLGYFFYTINETGFLRRVQKENWEPFIDESFSVGDYLSEDAMITFMSPDFEWKENHNAAFLLIILAKDLESAKSLRAELFDQGMTSFNQSGRFFLMDLSANSAEYLRALSNLAVDDKGNLIAEGLKKPTSVKKHIEDEFSEIISWDTIPE